MISESDLLPLSLLTHLVFCERRAVLVCVDQVWSDNEYTVFGTHVHQRTDVPSVEIRGNIRIVRGLRIRSLQLGLVGIADCVEFGPDVFPVEYKSGRLRRESSFEVQLCAQAMCLEEMLEINVPRGAIYYGKNRRRYEVEFVADLRKQTEAAASRLHGLIRQSVVPLARKDKKCTKCSLVDDCLPGLKSVAAYMVSICEE